MSEPLRRTREVRAVLSHGRVHHGAHTVVRYRTRGDTGAARWTVSAGRRVGSAVARNRAKRRLRAAVRELVLAPGIDIVVIARPSARECPFNELRADLRALDARSSTVRASA